jgi:hypothetical protein
MQKSTRKLTEIVSVTKTARFIFSVCSETFRDWKIQIRNNERQYAPSCTCVPMHDPVSKYLTMGISTRPMPYLVVLFAVALMGGISAARTDSPTGVAGAVDISTVNRQADQPLTAGAGDYRNVASWREKGVKVIVSSRDFRNGPLTNNRGINRLISGKFRPGEPSSMYWASNPYQHLPQWVWIHFPGPRRINKVILYAANAASAPVNFSGQYSSIGGANLHTLFHFRDALFNPRTLSYTIYFEPIITNNFRFVINKNAAPVTPQSRTATLAQVKVYGTDAENNVPPAYSVASQTDAPDLHVGLQPTGFMPVVSNRSRSVAIRTPWYRIVLDRTRPHINVLSWDSLGQGELKVNFLNRHGAGPVLHQLFTRAPRMGRARLTRQGNVFTYSPVMLVPGVYEKISIRTNQRGFDLALSAVANRKIVMRGGLFRFHFAANQTPTTFVCHPSRIMNYVATPCYLAAPDFGTAYITRTGDPCAFYRTPEKVFIATRYWVDITPHAPMTEDGLNEIGLKPWRTVLHFTVKRLEPLPDLVGHDPRLKRFPKYSLDITQWRPDLQMVSNSVMSLDCGLAVLFYAQESLFVPHLQDVISPMALVKETVNRYLKGYPGYMMPANNVYAADWHTASDETPAYLIISGWYVIRTIGGIKQLHRWLEPLECVANDLAADFHPDGLISHPGPERLWFDTYNIRGADAYANAADYRAFRCMDDLETLAGRPAMAQCYREDARRIKDVYFKLFYDPRTGVLAGWRSKGGKLHDYMFPWVNGFAICQGLVPHKAAIAILERLLSKLKAIGFHSYQLGLPTNLIPFSPADYIPHTSGAPRQANGMDTWQVYMNGGATPAYEYYVIQALYMEGLHKAAERLLWPLMQSYEKGTFNCGVTIRGKRQRNPVGSAFYAWNGSIGRGEGYLPENWDGIEALFTGHYGIGFNKNGYFLEPWSPLNGQSVKLNLPYMGKLVPYIK